VDGKNPWRQHFRVSIRLAGFGDDVGNVMWILDRPQETLKDMLHDFCWLSVSHEGFRRDAIISCCKQKNVNTVV